jgi:hypothetical protein
MPDICVVRRAFSGSARWFDWDEVRFRPFRLVTATSGVADPVGTAGPVPTAGGVVADAEQRGVGRSLRRQRGRLGVPKAITAAAHKLARIVYHLMRYGEAYVKQTEKQYAAEVRERQEKQLKRRAKELGFELKKVEPPAE